MPLSGRALSIPEQIPAVKGNSLFSSATAEGKPITIGRKIRDRAQNLSGVEDFNIHELYRTLATNVRPLGFSAEFADRVMDQLISSISAVYNRYDYLPEKSALLDA